MTIARSLHRHGVRTIVAVAGRHHVFPISSRAIAAVVHLGGGIDDAARLLRMVAESEWARWIVPTSDLALTVVCAGYEGLSRVCPVGCPPPRIVNRVLDKAATLEVAVTCGVPISASFKAWPPNSDRSGDAVGVDILIASGEVVASFQHRRLSENSPVRGDSVVEMSERVDPVLLDHSVRLLRALEWEGVAKVEFERDRETDEAVLTNVIGRFSGSLALAVAAGVDFPYCAWQVSQGIAPTVPALYPDGLRVRWTAGAFRRFAYIFAESDDRLPAWDGVRQLLAAFQPGIRSAMWSWSDPAPALQEVGSVLGDWFSAAISGVLRFLLPASALSTFKSARTLPPDRRSVYMKRRLAQMAGRERDVVLPAVIRSVIFVCHGNIMRSASAAQFLRNDLASAGITDVHVASAGTHARNGTPADPRVRRAASRLGVNLDDHRATLLTADMVASNDVIFAMDEFNYANIATAFPDSRPKLMLLGGMNALGVYRAHEIPDPYAKDEAGVATTVSAVRDYVAALAVAIRQRRTPAG